MVDRRLSTMSAIDHSRAPMEGSSALAERKQMLARVDDLAGQSALVLSRLSRRMHALEEDVAPVHEQTRNMYLQHKNLGLGIAALGDFCEQLQCVIRLKQQLDLESRDWEKLTSALQDVTDCVSFLRGHRTFSHNRQIIATVEDVRTAAGLLLWASLVLIVLFLCMQATLLFKLSVMPTMEATLMTLWRQWTPCRKTTAGS